jgi:hypothetical protein
VPPHSAPIPKVFYEKKIKQNRNRWELYLSGKGQLKETNS